MAETRGWVSVPCTVFMASGSTVGLLWGNFDLLAIPPCRHLLPSSLHPWCTLSLQLEQCSPLGVQGGLLYATLFFSFSSPRAS